jgi:hypothetical protein
MLAHTIKITYQNSKGETYEAIYVGKVEFTQKDLDDLKVIDISVSEPEDISQAMLDEIRNKNI